MITRVTSWILTNQSLSTNPAFFVFFVLERPGHFPYFSAFSSFLYLLVLIVGVPVRPLAHCAVLAEPGAHLRFETPSATGALLVLVSFCLFSSVQHHPQRPLRFSFNLKKKSKTVQPWELHEKKNSHFIKKMFDSRKKKDFSNSREFHNFHNSRRSGTVPK